MQLFRVKHILYLAVVLLFAACTKDLKDVSDPGAYSAANYPNSMAQLKAVLGGAYSNLRTQALWGFEVNAHDIYLMDHTADLGYGGDPNWSDLSRNAWNASNGYIYRLWSACYVGAQRVNTYLDAAEFYRKHYAHAGDSAELTLEAGEAHFLRALYYFYLANMFCPPVQDGNGMNTPAIPIVRKTAATLKDTYVGKSSVREVWDYIISDLITADQQLQKHQWDAGNIGRVPGWAPNALLAKAYVFTGDYARAKAVLKDIIDNSGHSLMPFDIYKNMFNGDNEFNNESFYEINIQNDFSINYGIFTGDNITASCGLIIAPTCMNIKDTSAIANGYGNIFVHDKNLKRFGFNLPLWKMVPNPSYDPARPAGPYNPANVCDPAYVQQSLALRQKKLVDPRLYVAALQPWVDSVGTDSSGTVVRRIVLKYKEIPANLKSQYYGWSLRKYGPIDNNIFAVKATDKGNVHIVRLADIYLLYAEACMRTGDNATALEYINKVHRRAYGLSPDAASAADYKTLTDNTMATDPVLANNPLRYERWAELFGEGQWWFDLRRWKLGEQEAAYYDNTVQGKIAWTAGSYYFPIPQLEVDNNPALK